MRKFNLKCQIATGVILIITGIALLLSNYVKDKRDEVFSSMNLALSSVNIQNIENEEDSQEVIEEDDTSLDNEEVNTYEEYLGIIEINKINLYKGFYSKTSSLNNVKFNLYVLPESNYPDADKGNLIIAGHSGNYNNSYFANLYQLSIDDTINIYYNGSKYIYKITNIYYENKTGTIRIFRDKNKTTLTLVTCTKDDESHQTVYIAELINKE